MLDVTNHLDALFAKLETHAILSPDDRDAILALPHTMKTLSVGSYMVREGDAADQCALILSGFAFRHKTTREGARQIVAINIPGDIIDLQHLFLDVTDHNVQALTRVTTVSLPSAAVRAIARARPNIAHAFLVNVLMEASIFRKWVLNVGRRHARARVAHLLCEFALRLDRQGLSEGQGYELPMNQEQIGDAVGLTSVHVNRTLRDLEASGLIARTRRHISFPGWKELREVADFDGRYLHLKQEAA